MSKEDYPGLGTDTMPAWDRDARRDDEHTERLIAEAEREMIREMDCDMLDRASSGDPFWKKSDGSLILVREMTIGHLASSWAMLARWPQTAGVKVWRRILHDELTAAVDGFESVERGMSESLSRSAFLAWLRHAERSPELIAYAESLDSPRPEAP